MLAAGRSRATYTPEAAPILKLLRELAARPAARDLVVERPGFRLALHAGGPLPPIVRASKRDIASRMPARKASSSTWTARSRSATRRAAVMSRCRAPSSCWRGSSARACPSACYQRHRQAAARLCREPPDGRLRPCRRGNDDALDLAAAWLVARGIKRVRVLGNAGTAAPLIDAGIEVIGPSVPAKDVEAVYTGWYREFCFHDLEAAVQRHLVRRAGGHREPCPLLRHAGGQGTRHQLPDEHRDPAWTGTMPKVLGKPSRECFFTALSLMGLPRSAATGRGRGRRRSQARDAHGQCGRRDLGGGGDGAEQSGTDGGCWRTCERPQLALASVADLLD